MSSLTGLLLGMHDASEVREQYLRLPFGYPGSKAEQLDKILPHLPQREGYGEPFGGSGIVLLNRRASKLEVYNDRYSGVTCFFRVVRDKDKLPLLLERLEATLHSREEFIWCKETWKDHQDDIERAARWYYIIRHAVNSKPRSTFGRSISSKATFAGRLHKSLPLFKELSERLQTVQIENMDWRQLLTDYDAPDFVWYLDPTYLGSTKGTYDFELDERDHIELCERAQRLKGFVALSGYDNEETKKIYDKYHWDEVHTWVRTTTALTQAFNAENGLLDYQSDSSRSKATVTECLWVRHN